MVHEKDQFLEFKIFKQFKSLKHGFSTRLGGVSEGVFESLNFSAKSKDPIDNVVKNYEIFADAMQINNEKYFLSDQVHKDAILIVEPDHLVRKQVYKPIIKEVDGLMTNHKNINLTTFYADCVPLFFYDSHKHVIALSHAGWRGTSLKLAVKTLRTMRKHFNSSYKDIYVGIGPSASQSCYEVDGEIRRIFEKAINYDIISAVFLKREDKKDKYMLDLKMTNYLLLIEEGLKKENIEVAKECTVCNENLFFSHRRMGENRGLHIGVMTLL